MGKFYKKITAIPAAYDVERAGQVLADLSSAIAANEELKPLGALIEKEVQVKNLLGSVAGSSPYLAGLMLRDPATLLECLTSDPADFVATLNENVVNDVALADSQKQAMARLRDHKRRIAFSVALADVGGVWSNDEVTQALSDAADCSVTAVLRHLFARAAGSGELIPRDESAPEADGGFFVLGMGKLGAGELNYSSDIDLIVFFDSDRLTLKEGLEPAPFFVRLTRELVKMLQERTAQGYVWRTDLRLRPDPGATQLALSTEAGLTYYESFGQNWERAALIKARVVAGDEKAGADFLAQLSPFIWRRYLDFAAVADIHAMKRRVHEFQGHARIAVAGHDIKLGRGGIREIEFFTQTQQLIAGGRQPELRTPKTLVTLDCLARQGWIEQQAAKDLSEAYRFLRTVEHRLQMIADEQTHRLPKSGEELERVARFSGFANAEEFSSALVAQLTKVQQHYDNLFARLPDIGESDDKRDVRPDDELPETIAALEESGFSDPDAVVEVIRSWRAGRYAATRSLRSRETLSKIQIDLLSALSETSDPDAALTSFDRFLSELPAGVQLFSLLRSRPGLLRLIADIMGTAPRLARVLSRRSRILDAVLDPGLFGDVPSLEDLGGMIERDLAATQDFQDCLDRARRIGQEQAFLIGVRILSGAIGADQAGGAYACLAQTLIRALHNQVDNELTCQHGRIAGGEAAVIAMGKLGGREMTASSDLDLIIVYDFDDEAGASDGARPLAGGQYYARFTQRLISALSAQTAEGALFEVDMRLRPSGHSGPVATRFDSFVDYQHEQAWTWEHLALVRARVMSGPQELVDKIEAAIRHVLTQPRDRGKIAAEVHDMRARIAKEKGTDDIWDIKQVRGGLVDLEFIAQFLQVVSAHDHPGILEQNTAKGFEKLAHAGVLAKRDAERLIPAAELYHNLTQVLRLCLERPFDAARAPLGLRELLVQAAGASSFAALEKHLSGTEKLVHEAYERLVT